MYVWARLFVFSAFSIQAPRKAWRSEGRRGGGNQKSISMGGVLKQASKAQSISKRSVNDPEISGNSLGIESGIRFFAITHLQFSFIFFTCQTHYSSAKEGSFIQEDETERNNIVQMEIDCVHERPCTNCSEINRASSF